MHCHKSQLWVHAGLKVIRWAVLCMGTTWSGHKEIYWLVSCFSRRTLNIKSIKHAHKCTCMTHWQASSNSQNHVTCKDQLVSGGLSKKSFQYEERKKAHYSFNSIWIREKNLIKSHQVQLNCNSSKNNNGDWIKDSLSCWKRRKC